MQWLFLLVSTLAWGIAEIFYKKGNLDKEKYSHLKLKRLEKKTDYMKDC